MSLIGSIVSPSKLICFRECPELFKHRYIEQVKETTKSMEFGTLIHMAILEPEKFALEYARLPKTNDKNDLSLKQLKDMAKELGLPVSGTKAELIARIRGVTDLEKQLDEITEDFIAQGVQVISPDLESKIEAIKKNLQAFPFWNKLIDGAQCEVPMSYIDEKHDLLVKCKVDGMNLKLTIPTIFDLKITSDWSPKWFDKKNFETGRHLQAAAYVNAVKKNHGIEASFVFIAVEPVAPFRVRFYQCDEGMIDAGQTELDFYCAEYKERMENNDWSPRDNVIHSTTLTSWDWERIKEVI